MFQCLIANLEQKKICCYWNKQYNLLSIYSDVQLNSMYNKYNALHKKWLRAMNEFNYKEIYSIVCMTLNILRNYLIEIKIIIILN